jgi:hypothetical protein
MGAVLQVVDQREGGLGRTRGDRRAIAAGDAERAEALIASTACAPADNLGERCCPARAGPLPPRP